MAAGIPTWQERLKACFRWRQRLLHVFGAPGAVGALTSVAAAASLTPQAGLALGALTAGTGVLLAGYYVVAGFDRKLVTQLQDEASERARGVEQAELSRVLSGCEPAVRAQLERCLALHTAIEAVFVDGVNDAVEAVLQNSRPDLQALQSRAIAMAELHQRLGAILQECNAETLWHEVQRMDRELAETPEGAVRDARLAARNSNVRAIEQWRSAFDKRAQVESVLTLIENNLQEFKLAMELRKADAALGSVTFGRDVSELQARLIATGEACDELVGRPAGAERPLAKRRRAS